MHVLHVLAFMYVTLFTYLLRNDYYNTHVLECHLSEHSDPKNTLRFGRILPFEACAVQREMLRFE